MKICIDITSEECAYFKDPTFYGECEFVEDVLLRIQQAIEVKP